MILPWKIINLNTDPPVEAPRLDISVGSGMLILIQKPFLISVIAGDVSEIKAQITGQFQGLRLHLPGDHLIEHEEAVVEKMGLDLFLQHI